MKKNFTLYTKILLCLSFLCALLCSGSIYAQVGCPNATVIWHDDFGTGTTATSSPAVLNFEYQETGSLTSEGTYRIIDNSQQKPEWVQSSDHTGNLNGKMLVANAQSGVFYQQTISNTHGFTEGNYTVSLYALNVDSLGVCSPDPLEPVFNFRVEYLSESNVWTSLAGSPFMAAPVQQSNEPVWVHLGSTFTLPSTGAFFPTQFRVTIADSTGGGCGNDFAVDDISLALCPAGGPTPVQLTDFTARRKGSGVSLDWSTSQELNNKYFQVERSADGSSDWTVLTTVNGAGNSQTVKNYNAFDGSPLAGANYYRLKQVDFDGVSAYSKTVTVKMDLQKTSISVLTNPFHNTLSVNFASPSSLLVSARLIDITGKQIAFEKWSLSPGNTRKDFGTISNLQTGMYILTITNNSGEIIYNGKVIKQ
ncbi:MAG TPA: T9SS type A sorting domain-containing protein [Hanamia sp.]|nr:T9SS type A sorting domain-containing protein [Hanamia sp.]